MNQKMDSAHDSALDLFSLKSEHAAPGRRYGHVVMRVDDLILLNTHILSHFKCTQRRTSLPHKLVSKNTVNHEA